MKTTLYYKSDYNQIRLHSVPNVLDITLLAISYDGSMNDRLYMVESYIYNETDLKSRLVFPEFPGTWIDMVDALYLGKQLQPDRDIDGEPFSFDLPSQPSFLELQQDRELQHDKRTVQLISNGFEFDSHTFSLSNEAIYRWTDMYNHKDDLSFYPVDPIPVSAKDVPEYLLLKSDVDNFYKVGQSVVKTIVDGGRLLNKQVYAATTLQQLYDINDTRV